MIRCESDHFVFYKYTSSKQCIYLIVYMDDIVITGSDQGGIEQLKTHLFRHFQTKDLGLLRYFLDIEVAQSKSNIVLSQRKYALNILEETRTSDCRPTDSPMDPNSKLLPDQGMGKLSYLTITQPNISFLVSVDSQFLQAPCDSHWGTVIRNLRYIKGAPGKDYYMKTRVTHKLLDTLMLIA
ncbi:hypothetical protein K2173_003529 [Erythroxylum novogranatense]|uniref:Reverse transcriptase Ty1/copia-type domain-containing protein n=1 Tax=Erythroxylum novogranatense TaxID=1862640 RepID=A0AAV8TAB3_9ROSI|nr:hypothetical protein K2173_003529 [Erythroxylum novogranatense]